MTTWVGRFAPTPGACTTSGAGSTRTTPANASLISPSQLLQQLRLIIRNLLRQAVNPLMEPSNVGLRCPGQFKLPQTGSIMYPLTAVLSDVKTEYGPHRKEYPCDGAVNSDQLEQLVHYWKPTSPSISIVSDVAADAKPLRKSVEDILVLAYRST